MEFGTTAKLCKTGRLWIFWMSAMRVGIEVLFWQGDTIILWQGTIPLLSLFSWLMIVLRTELTRARVRWNWMLWSAAYWRDLSLDVLFGKSLWSLFFTDWYKDTSSRGQELPPKTIHSESLWRIFKYQWHSAEWYKNDQMQGNFQHYIPDISQYIPGWVPFGARLFTTW